MDGGEGYCIYGTKNVLQKKGIAAKVLHNMQVYLSINPKREEGSTRSSRTTRIIHESFENRHDAL